MCHTVVENRSIFNKPGPDITTSFYLKLNSKDVQVIIVDPFNENIKRRISLLSSTGISLFDLHHF